MVTRGNMLPVMLIALFFLSSINAITAQVNTLERPFDPVVLTGASMEDLAGTPLDQLFVFSFDSVAGTWREVPFQIDEYNSSTGSFVGEDSTAGLDADDELVFMAKDVGDRATASWPDVAGSTNTPRYEIEVETAAGKGWVYVLFSDQYTLSTPVEDYVTYQGPVAGIADDMVTGKTYVVGNSENGLPVDLNIPESAGGNGVDILAGLQLSLVGKAGPITLTVTEENFVSAGVESVDGNLRVIRELLLSVDVLGQELFSDIRLPVFYYPYSYFLNGSVDIPASLPLGASIEDVRQSVNLNSDATGLKMYTKRDAGITIDGQPDTIDKTINAGDEEWLLFTGTQGTFVNIFTIPTIGATQELFYVDLFVADFQYGNAGFKVSGGQIVGPTPLGLKSIFPGEIAAGDELTLGAQLAEPLQVSTLKQTYGEVTTVRRITAGNTLPTRFGLEQNYPNPFNPTTEISYHLPEQQQALLVVYNLIGQEVKTLVDRNQLPGSYRVTWDGTDRFGNLAPSGIYVYRLRAGSFIESKKMMLVK